MQPLDAVYLIKILKNFMHGLSEPVPLDGVDPSALYRLAVKTLFSFRFFCHYLNSSRSFCSQTADEADAALLLSAGTFYTPYFFAPPCGEDSLLSLKGHQSRRQLSHSRISEAGRSGSLYSRKRCFFPCLPDS